MAGGGSMIAAATRRLSGTKWKEKGKKEVEERGETVTLKPDIRFGVRCCF